MANGRNTLDSGWGKVSLGVALRDNPQMTPDKSPPRKMLFDFTAPGTLADWSAVDDVVMGGASRSGLHACTDGHGSFQGVVSLANGGGFASVRCRPLPLGLDGATVCSIEVCGDGRRYKLNLRTDDTFDGVNYQIGFSPPAGEWVRIALPLSDFAPSRRGRPAPDAPTLDPSRIRQVDLMIADRQAGPFRLFIRRIELAGTADAPSDRVQ